MSATAGHSLHHPAVASSIKTVCTNCHEEIEDKDIKIESYTNFNKIIKHSNIKQVII